MEIHQLWPTYLYDDEIDLENTYDLIKPLLPDNQTIKNYQSIRPWCTEDLLHEQDEFKPIVDKLIHHAKEFANAQSIFYDDLYITSMWVNAQYQQQNHVAHTHPNSFFSGILYVKIPENSQIFQIWDPRPQNQVIEPMTQYLKGNFGIFPKEGKLMIWPSWLLHATHSISCEELTEPRISIAFNVMLKTKINKHSARVEFK